MPMPPVRIVPASTAEDRAAADAQSREAGNRFRRMLDAQQRRAAASVMPSVGGLSGHWLDPAPTLPEAPCPAHEASAPDARQQADREAPPAPQERHAEPPARPHDGGEPDAARRSAGASPRGNTRTSDPASGAADASSRGDARQPGPASGPAGVPSRGGPAGTVTPAGLPAARLAQPQRPELAPVATALQRDARDGTGARAGESGSHDSDAHDRGPRTFPPNVVAQLERDVVEFCGAGDLLSDGPTRTVTLTPDPRVLPDTQLTMTISPDALSLRFHSESARSRELLCLHGDTLKSRLALRTGRTVDLAIVTG